MFFSYQKLFYEEGINSDIYKEKSVLSKLDFNYKERVDVALES